MVGDDEVTKEVKDYMPPVYHSEFRDFKGWTKMITEDNKIIFIIFSNHKVTRWFNCSGFNN
jgi:hypothetical protein